MTPGAKPLSALLAAVVASHAELGCYGGLTGNAGGVSEGFLESEGTAIGSSNAEEGGTGDNDEGGSDAGESQGHEPGSDAKNEIAVSGLRRLSIVEYQQTIADLLSIAADDAVLLLPADTYTPFDNDYTLQTPSEPLIKGLELLAGDLADAIVASESLRSPVLGCTPAGADDIACFRSFISTFGRRALRRPLLESEVDGLASLFSFSQDTGDFWEGVRAALRVFLQHPEFVYRVEIGEPVEGHPELRRLGDYELAARMSYLLIGSTTPDWLLDAVAAGDLAATEDVAAAAEQLLSDERGHARIQRFHALWLKYEKLSSDGIFGDMRMESNALIERVVFEDGAPWIDVLSATETFLTPELAEHYGLPSPGATAGWVPYGDSGRMGLLSHGAFLSVGAKFGDTSPTQRGLLVRTSLFCEVIPPPPPDLMVNVDEPPQGNDPNACKLDRYDMSTRAACQGCHSLMDPIGFGLEAYDASGVFRSTQRDRPDCPIAGEGEFRGLGTFNGPAELARLAIDSGRVEACAVEQFYRFAVGRFELDEHDRTMIDRLVESAGGDFDLRSFLTEYVSADAFRFRREGES